VQVTASAVSLTVDDVAASSAFLIDHRLEFEEKRLRDEGVTITLPLPEEPWGERLFQITDPNGVVIELVEWVQPSGE
jgi:uncharacterized glyoxalase superfamily protein PhnB